MEIKLKPTKKSIILQLPKPEDDAGCLAEEHAGDDRTVQCQGIDCSECLFHPGNYKAFRKAFDGQLIKEL